MERFVTCLRPCAKENGEVALLNVPMPIGHHFWEGPPSPGDTQVPQPGPHQATDVCNDWGMNVIACLVRMFVQQSVKVEKSIVGVFEAARAM